LEAQSKEYFYVVLRARKKTYSRFICLGDEGALELHDTVSNSKGHFEHGIEVEPESFDIADVNFLSDLVCVKSLIDEQLIEGFHVADIITYFDVHLKIFVDDWFVNRN
jgi:hypothetical protein